MAGINTIKGRLIILLVLLGTLLLASVLTGQWALSSSNGSLRTAYEDRVVPLGQFMTIREAYDRLVDASRDVREKAVDPLDAAGVLEAALASVNREWSAYLATYLTPEEKLLVAEMQTQIDQNGAIIRSVIDRLRARNLDGYGSAPII